MHWPGTFLSLILLAFGAGISNVTLAQTGTVSGRVLEAVTSEPLPGANVGIAGTTLGSATDENGGFVIEAVPAGTHTVVASSVGFETSRSSVAVLQGETTELELVLSHTGIELQEVEIVGRHATTYDAAYSFAATKTAVPITRVPQSISVVTKEVIDDQQLYTLNDATRNVSGVNTFSGYNDLTARGFRNQNVRLVNGLKTEFGFWQAPLLPHVERVEFIKGPASALFADANPGGTVNMVTKKPLDDTRKALSFTAGSFATYRAATDFTGPVTDDGSVLYRLNLAYENTESFRFLQGHESYVIAPSVSFLPSERTRVNADLVYARFDGKLDRGQAIFFGNTDLTSTPISFALSQPGDFQITTDFHLNLSLRHTFTDWLSFNSSYLKYRNDEDLSEHRTSNAFLPDEPSVLQLAFIRRVADRNVDNVTNYLVAHLASGPLRHEALVGFDYYRQDDNRSQWGARGDEYFISDGDSLQGGNVGNIDLESPVYHLNRDPETYAANWFSEPYADKPARRYSYGVYVQDRITSGRLDVLLGLRHEWYHDRLELQESAADEFAHIRQTALIPRVGFVYGLTDRVNAYATFSHGFQPQSASVVQQPERFGGPFDPETSELIETGLKNSLLGGRLLTTLAVYQISKRNVLVSANLPSEPDLLEQRGEIRSRGAEIDIVGSVSPSLQITANYALNETVVMESDDPAAIGRVNENAPRHQGGFWGKYTLRGGSLAGVSMGVGSRFVSERNTFEGSLQLPGYAVLDASLSYRVSQFVVTAYMDNILDETYWLGGYNYGRIYPGAPRTFRVKVAYTF